MSTSPYATDLTNSAWELIAPLLPGALPCGRPRTTDDRAVLNAIFDLLRTGCRGGLATGVSCVGGGLSLLPKLEERGRVEVPQESDPRTRSNTGWPGTVSFYCQHG